MVLFDTPYNNNYAVYYVLLNVKSFTGSMDGSFGLWSDRTRNIEKKR